VGELVFLAGKDPLIEIGGGHSVYVRAHARAAVRAGYHPHVFCAGWSTERLDTEFGTLHRVRSLWPLRQVPGMGSPSYLTLSPLHIRQLARAVAAFLRDRPVPHLVHGFGVWGSVAARVRRSLGAGSGLRVVVSSYTTNAHESTGKLHGLVRQHGRGARWAIRAQHEWVTRVVDREEARAVEGADLVLVNYDSVRRLLLERYPIAARCRRIPYAPESAFASSPDPAPAPKPQRGEEPLVVCVSRHDARKGIPVLLEAFAALKRAGTSFRAWLVGGGILLDAHRRMARDLGLGDCVAILGFVPDSGAYLREADVFVLPSLQEGSGSLSLLEALQNGVPVVASECDGVPEDVEDGESALLVKTGSAEDLARGLTALLVDAELRTRLGARGRDVFRARFSAEVLTDTLRRVYMDAGFPPERIPAGGSGS
jgi:glycosyltransferase involved in cell wall biosynthesis